MAANIVTRLRSGQYGSSINEIINAPGQYEGVYTGRSKPSPEIAARFKTPEGRQKIEQFIQEQQAAENNRNRWQDKKEVREERLLTRQLNAQTSADNLQLQYAQLASQERRDARDRKDRAILTLIEGLGNLGAAFTI